MWTENRIEAVRVTRIERPNCPATVLLCLPHITGTQKIAWIVRRERLVCVQKLTLYIDRPNEARSIAPESHNGAKRRYGKAE